MSEANADQLKSEAQPTTRVDRIKAGIGKFVENQLPPARIEFYRRYLEYLQTKSVGKEGEIASRLTPAMERVAKVAGWSDSILRVALTSAALYTGVNVILHPSLAGAAWSAAAVVGERAFRFVVGTAAVLGERVKQVFGNIVNRNAPITHGPVRPDMPGTTPPLAAAVGSHLDISGGVPMTPLI